jgi:hypothetical protein
VAAENGIPSGIGIDGSGLASQSKNARETVRPGVATLKRTIAMDDSKRYYFQCPKCHRDDEFLPPSESPSSLTWMLFFFGGLLPALLYADARSHRVQCSNCHHTFRQPPLPRSGVSRLATCFIGVIVVAGIALFFFWANPEWAAEAPNHPWIGTLYDLFMLNPAGTFLVGMTTCLILLLISIVALTVSNIRSHRELRKNYQTRPKRNARF